MCILLEICWKIYGKNLFTCYKIINLCCEEFHDLEEMAINGFYNESRYQIWCNLDFGCDFFGLLVLWIKRTIFFDEINDWSQITLSLKTFFRRQYNMMQSKFHRIVIRFLLRHAFFGKSSFSNLSYEMLMKFQINYCHGQVKYWQDNG